MFSFFNRISPEDEAALRVAAEASCNKLLRDITSQIQDERKSLRDVLEGWEYTEQDHNLRSLPYRYPKDWKRIQEETLGRFLNLLTTAFENYAQHEGVFSKKFNRPLDSAYPQSPNE